MTEIFIEQEQEKKHTHTQQPESRYIIVYFKEEKNTDMNAIKHTTQTKIQSTF